MTTQAKTSTDMSLTKINLSTLVLVILHEHLSHLLQGQRGAKVLEQLGKLSGTWHQQLHQQ